jgi:hypothetical protein
MAHPLSKLKLDFPLYVINWSPGGYTTITARHLISGRVLTATSIVELRALLANPPEEDPQ